MSQDQAIKAACIQLNCGPDIEENLATTAAFIREAAGQGATLIVTPENTDYIRRYAKDKLKISGDETTHPPIAFFAALAAELKVWLLIGSLGVKLNDTHLANRSFLFSPRGEITAIYDKLHMFDAKLSRTEIYKESADYKAGNRAILADIGQAPQSIKLGMSICYDVRFPHLYRDLAKAGAQILSIPAAFAVTTGKAHWEVLLRARAIETGSFILAPAQTGEHEGGRKTYGRSMIIGPWGEILAQAGTEPEIIMADLTLNEVTNARRAIPVLTHDQDYKVHHHDNG